jgi:hypothetical protein
LQALLTSKEHGNAVGILSSSFGPAIIMTAVDDLIDVENSKFVLLKENDVLGIRLPHPVLSLDEIVKVCLLRAKYNDPFHVRLSGPRSGRL